MTGESIVMPANWKLHWHYAAGEVGTKYLVGLRDRGEIMATKCPQCGLVYLPPRSYCQDCFVSLRNRWVKLPAEGTLRAFTIVTEPFEGLPTPPYVIGYFKIGHATNIPHFLLGVDLSDVERARERLQTGMPVKLVFKPRPERVGAITDFHIELA